MTEIRWRRPTWSSVLLGRPLVFAAYDVDGIELHREPVESPRWKREIRRGRIFVENAILLEFEFPSSDVECLSFLAVIEGQEWEVACHEEHWTGGAAITLRSLPGALKLEL